MLAYQSRPPDPEIVGDGWMEMWLDRLEHEPFFMAEWLSHQRRDAFWEHGSICEDFDGFPVPALVIAGWADGYRNTPLKAVEGMPGKAKALIGPWVHKYPHFAFPKPRADFIGEAIAWWNRWLRDEDNGADALPQMRAYILDGPRPRAGATATRATGSPRTVDGTKAEAASARRSGRLTEIARGRPRARCAFARRSIPGWRPASGSPASRMRNWPATSGRRRGFDRLR
jgi:uncharacterized protein